MSWPYVNLKIAKTLSIKALLVWVLLIRPRFMEFEKISLLTELSIRL